jgi:hypothetical protein
MSTWSLYRNKNTHNCIFDIFDVLQYLTLGYIAHLTHGSSVENVMCGNNVGRPDMRR